jgi:acyl-coenzyme A thioesterase PaaI-like protein
MARKISPRLLRLGMNLWPPYLGAGIRVRAIGADFRRIDVSMRLGLTNRNWFGTHFGGSLFAMTDPFFALMVVHNLPDDYLVWDKAASIDYLAPGRGTVRARFTLAQDDLDTIVRMTAAGDKHLHLFKVDVVDAEDLVVARVEKIVYVRRKRTAGLAQPARSGVGQA